MRRILFSHLAIFFLLFTWLLPATRPFWDWIDLHTFQMLNSWIATSKGAQNFWALSSHKGMDWAHDIVMLSFFAVAFVKSQSRRRVFAQFVITGILIGATILLFNRCVFKDGIVVHRHSPSLVVDGATHLSHKIDWMVVKDHSRQSYPADHATTALLFTALVFLFLGQRAGLLAALYAVYFCLPRLVCGAHWVTDIVMGSLPIVLFVTAWSFGTPFVKTAIRYLGGRDEQTV